MSAVRETPTYFGPAESPLFGVLHVPVESQVRGGVLVCASIGKDAADSINAQRLMADGLAQRGIAVLRFDYLGCGDSSYESSRPDAVDEWQASIEQAASYLRSTMDVDELSIVALRAGCLLATEAMKHCAALRSVKRVVLVDPIITGKRYLREQTTFFKMAAGKTSTSDGVVSLIGADLSARAASEFSGLTLAADESSVQVDTFVVTRPETVESVVAARTDTHDQDVFVSDELRAAAQPTRLLAPTPLDVVDAVVDWLDSRSPVQRSRIEPVITDLARIPDGAGGFVVEHIEFVGTRRLFAIRTVPDGPFPASPMPTAVFFTNAMNPHHGPSRSWVQLARASARSGRQAIRWDRHGAGESGPARCNEAVAIYSPQGLDDAIAATRHGSETASELLLIGLCSGAWYAAQGARTVGADSLALVNVLLWSWRVKKALKQPIASGEDDVTDWEQTPRAKLRQQAQAKLPAFVWRAIGRTGAVQAPEILLTPLARKGTSVTAILCPDDSKLFHGSRGGQALHRLRHRKAAPRVIETVGGDHAGFDPVFVEPLAGCIDDALSGDGRLQRGSAQSPALP